MAIPLTFIEALPVIFKGLTGAWQLIKASQFANKNRPTYEIPESVKQSLGIAEQLATQRELPGQQIMEDKMRAATANAISRMAEVSDSPAALLGNISKLVANENMQRNQLGILAANYYTQNQRALQNALLNYGNQELAKWQYNEAKPYDEAMRAAAMMREGGIQNIFGAATNMMQLEQNKEYLDLLKQVYNEKKPINTNTNLNTNEEIDTLTNDTLAKNAWRNLLNNKTYLKMLNSNFNDKPTNIDMMDVNDFITNILNNTTISSLPLSPKEMKKITSGDYMDLLISIINNK